MRLFAQRFVGARIHSPAMSHVTRILRRRECDGAAPRLFLLPKFSRSVVCKQLPKRFRFFFVRIMTGPLQDL